ncbi:MAG: ferritin-like domain-containing protein [Myxococcota bacterium]|jgi:uncharacterized ferritin-like protein (DUF455 family)|nr:ferritin-like domain-containing protein [Myxococcota bacterium]
MKRFMESEDLARDRRFKRTRSQNTLMRSLPDDVNEIVRIFESIGHKLRERVSGTILEEVYDDLGPGFQFLTASGGRQSKDERTPLQLRMQLHGIFVGEIQALEAAGRTVWDFPDTPWEFKRDMARQCWDEARHVQAYEKLIEHAGGKVGEFPESTFLFDASCHDDPVLRITGVNRCLEGLACDAFRSLIDYGKNVGDDIIAQAIDFVLADELTHVRFGSEWVKEMTRGDSEHVARAREFQRETERSFSFGSQRELAREERLEAGFTEEELDEIESLSDGGPKRESLIRAAEILRDRHRARKNGEEVAPL